MRRMRPVPAVFLALLLACAAVDGARASSAAPDLLASARQMLLVVTSGWDEVRGQLRRFERDGAAGPWRLVGDTGAIVVGRNGLAWDPLTVPVVPGPAKREGDGRSPAGVFAIGRAFGFAPPAEAAWTKLPYLPLAEGIECVDDPASTVYNQLVDRRTVRQPDWNSAERMREVGEAYRWGVVVDYNTPAVSGRGSCIFLHIGDPDGTGTAGCTAMPVDDLREVMAWLDPSRAPVVVQLPRAAYDALRSEWALP
ncbi:MAG: L,D-transpeptidase family protein [Vicinamibacterales bacterium]